MKILRSRKALSPVVASIILIAVTVAVSIAVAAWMGALSFSFMGTGESLQVGTPYAWNATSVTITVTNTGGGIVTIKWFRVAGLQVALNSTATPPGIQLGPKDTQDVVCSPATFALGYSYTIVLITSNNKEFPTTGTYNP